MNLVFGALLVRRFRFRRDPVGAIRELLRQGRVAGVGRVRVNVYQFRTLSVPMICELAELEGFDLALRGQDHRARGWPLQVGPARPEDRPQSREDLLRERLRAAGRSGRTTYDLDLVHFEDLGMQHVAKVAEAFGWRTGGVTLRPLPRVRLNRSPYDAARTGAGR